MKVSREKVIIAAGVWLVILPFTGFPHSWKTMLTIATGLVVLYVGALINRHARAYPEIETTTSTFTETM